MTTDPVLFRPKEIFICGHEVKIIYKNLGAEMYACYDGNKKVIYLNTKRSVRWDAQKLFHEIIHAILHLTGQSQHLGGTLEEAIVEAIELNLYPHVSFNFDPSCHDCPHCGKDMRTK